MFIHFWYECPVCSHCKEMRFPIARKTQVQNTQDAVLKSTDTSLDSRCNMGMKWVDPLDPPRPPDQIAPLVQLLPQGCVHIFWVQARSKGNIYIYCGKPWIFPGKCDDGSWTLNPDASHVHSWLILKYLEVLAKLKYTGLSWGSRWRAIQLPSALCPLPSGFRRVEGSEWSHPPLN